MHTEEDLEYGLLVVREVVGHEAPSLYPPTARRPDAHSVVSPRDVPTFGFRFRVAGKTKRRDGFGGGSPSGSSLIHEKEEAHGRPDQPQHLDLPRRGPGRQRYAGYSIEATDGEIGKVDKHVVDPAGSYLLVATGPWIFGKTVMLPAGVISRI